MAEEAEPRGGGAEPEGTCPIPADLGSPAPDGSVHTGVGFYGKDASDGGSRNVHLSGFAIEGDVRERIDTDQVNGVGRAMSDSTIDGLYIHHTKVGMWFDGPMSNLRITNSVITDQIADGLNFHTGATDWLVRNNVVRNSGDDGLAMWSEKSGNARNVGAVGVNNCGSFNFPAGGSEFSLTDPGGNDGGGATGTWLGAWQLPTTITCDDRPPVVAPPGPTPW